jgi:hypothetical protein
LSALEGSRAAYKSFLACNLGFPSKKKKKSEKEGERRKFEPHFRH